MNKEYLFQAGLKNLNEGKYEKALLYFYESNPRGSTVNAKAMSYFGLCLAKINKHVKESIALCKKAVLLDAQNPELYMNLAEVFLVRGERQKAIKVLFKGLRFDNQEQIILSKLMVLAPRQKTLHSISPGDSRKGKSFGKAHYSLQRKSENSLDEAACN